MRRAFSCGAFLFSFTASLHSTPSRASDAGVVCPPLDRAALRSRLARGDNGENVKLVFFSTWCSDCTAHLRGIEGQQGAIAVATFDTREKVEKTLSRMKIHVNCAMDDGLAKELGVKVVPADRILTPGTILK
jgi:hypothetical protein